MKNIKLIILSTLIIFIAACEKEDVIKTNDLGTEFLVSGGYTTLDGVAIIEIDNQQSNLSSVSVTNLGGMEADEETEIEAPAADLGSISLSGGDGSTTYDDATIGLEDQQPGAYVDLEMNSSFSGKSITRFYSLAVDFPIHADYPDVTHRNDTTFTFEYKVTPAVATVTDVTIQTKVGALSDYTDKTGDWGATGSFEITGADYNVDDTLFVNIIASSDAGRTESLESEVVILPIMVENSESFTLNMMDKLAYDFIHMEVVDTTAGVNVDMKITGEYPSSGPAKIGFKVMNNAEFVMGTSADFANADILTIYNMDFSNPVMMNDNVAGGEVYFFRTKRSDTDWFYGVLKITAVEKPQGVLEDSYMEIEFKY